MQRDIDLDQIISVLNLSTSEQEHMSFRLSEDYQPNYFRYSKDDQLQEITFNLSNDEGIPEMDQSSQNDLKITQENPQDKIPFILDESKEQSVKSPPEEKPTTAETKISLNRKTSIKASEILKRKISVKKESDEFTKKYDDLFDEIFFKQKAKENKNEPAKQTQEDKKENSLTSTNNENFSSSNVSSENNLSISRAIDQALTNAFTSVASSEQKITNPKVVITYESKIVINIRPPKQLLGEPVEVNPSKPKIKFSYGQAETSKSPKKSMQLGNVPYHIKQQNRLPAFMISFRNKTNSYPNFYSKNGFTEETCNKINQQFTEILQQCKATIKRLKQSHLTLHQLFTKIRELYKKMSQNILNHKAQQDLELINLFLDNDWSSYLKAEALQTIRPRDYFLNRPFHELEFITFINTFEEIVIKLQLQSLLSPDNPETIKTYMDSRDKLWGIQKNLRLLSEDLYLYSISHFNLPSHFFQSHQVLKAIKAQEELTFDAAKSSLLKKLLFLQENKDIFGSSWLGLYTIECLCNLKK